MFPNKVITISESIFPIMVDIITMVDSGKHGVLEIYKELSKKYDVDMIAYSLDVLYSIGYLELDEGGRLNVVQN